MSRPRNFAGDVNLQFDEIGVVLVHISRPVVGISAAFAAEKMRPRFSPYCFGGTYLYRGTAPETTPVPNGINPAQDQNQNPTNELKEVGWR